MELERYLVLGVPLFTVFNIYCDTYWVGSMYEQWYEVWGRLFHGERWVDGVVDGNNIIVSFSMFILCYLRRSIGSWFVFLNRRFTLPQESFIKWGVKVQKPLSHQKCLIAFVPYLPYIPPVSYCTRCGRRRELYKNSYDIDNSNRSVDWI